MSIETCDEFTLIKGTNPQENNTEFYVLPEPISGSLDFEWWASNLNHEPLTIASFNRFKSEFNTDTFIIAAIDKDSTVSYMKVELDRIHPIQCSESETAVKAHS